MGRHQALVRTVVETHQNAGRSLEVLLATSLEAKDRQAAHCFAAALMVHPHPQLPDPHCPLPVEMSNMLSPARVAPAEGGQLNTKIPPRPTFHDVIPQYMIYLCLRRYVRASALVFRVLKAAFTLPSEVYHAPERISTHRPRPL